MKKYFILIIILFSIVIGMTLITDNEITKKINSITSKDIMIK